MQIKFSSQRLYINSILLASILLFLSCCAHQPMPIDHKDVPGFFMGLLHGLLIILSLIGGFFNDDIRIYAYPNSGWWYDLGYLIGVALLVEETARKA